MRFDFAAWAKRERFRYPPRAAAMLHRVGSPAEAYFVRALFELDGVALEGECARFKGITIRIQVPFARYVIDAVAERSFCKLAVEIDGFANHHATPQIVSADYFRARRLMYAGFVVVRFTAREVMANGRAAWRSIFEIIRVQLDLRT